MKRLADLACAKTSLDEYYVGEPDADLGVLIRLASFGPLEQRIALMTTRIAIVGSGPTAIYCLNRLLSSTQPLTIAIFEAQAEAGKGMPYHPALNDAAMLANIASIEIPPVCETLVGWLSRLPDADLADLHISRDRIDARAFYPRLVLGAYFQAQLDLLIERAGKRGHIVKVKPLHRVDDIALHLHEIHLTVHQPDNHQAHYAFDHVVIATGHTWPDENEIKPGFFASPWPKASILAIEPCPVGILGTSLSAIDALVTLASKYGAFYFDERGDLSYQCAATADAFHATLMSRKGLLPEADFYCPLPYEPLAICTREAMDALAASTQSGLLDAAFNLFRRELALADPAYADSIGLANLTIETIGPAYFAEREAHDGFTWAALNLAEAKHNKDRWFTVPWRYAILRMHESIARIVPHLDVTDLKRFHRYFKVLFVDDYATVPHESIDRLLALKRAGRLDLVTLGADYQLSSDAVERGAEVTVAGQTMAFQAFIDATGQHALTARDLPFPTLHQQGVVHPVSTRIGTALIRSDHEPLTKETGGIDIDDHYRLKFSEPLCNELYCVALPYLLHKNPFIQGLTSAFELGVGVATAILDTSANRVASRQAA